MIIGMTLAVSRPFRNYNVDLHVTNADLVYREPLTGRFLGFDKTDSKWLEVLAAAEADTTLVTVEGRAYKLASLDSDQRPQSPRDERIWLARGPAGFEPPTPCLDGRESSWAVRNARRGFPPYGPPPYCAIPEELKGLADHFPR
jgi:hypothetical protein